MNSTLKSLLFWMVLVVVGVLMLTGRLTWITITAQRGLSSIGLDFWDF